jgi:tetratricopeptide (TPR) repeat protein
MKRLAFVLIAAGVVAAAVMVQNTSSSGVAGQGDSAAASTAERNRVQRFWETYRRATEARIAGRWQDAADEYTRALALEPEHYNSLYYLGNAELALGNLAAAEQAWRRLAEVDSTSARAHSQLGTLYFCIGGGASLHPDRASAEFERAAAINREETGPLLSLGEIALVRGDFEAAQQYVDDVLGSNYSSVAAHFYKGYLLWARGATDRAAELLTTAASYARPPQGTAETPSEGDTAEGRPGQRARPPVECNVLRKRATELVGQDTSTTRDVGGVYQAFDALLREVRKNLPS